MAMLGTLALPSNAPCASSAVWGWLGCDNRRSTGRLSSFPLATYGLGSCYLHSHHHCGSCCIHSHHHCAALSLLALAASSRRSRRPARRSKLTSAATAVPREVLEATFLSDIDGFEAPWAQPPAGQRLPRWLRGALLRNGVGRYRTPSGGRLRHLFDGYGFLTRWDLDGAANRVRCSGRFVESRASAAVRLGLAGRPRQMEFAEFGTAPGRDRPAGRGGRWAGFLRSALSGVTDNANVNVVRLPRGGAAEGPLWVAMSEPAAAQFLVDPTTLRTLRAVGRPSFPPPLLGPLLQTAHPLRSRALGGLVNVATRLLPLPGYAVTLTRASAGGGLETATLAELPCAGPVPSWVHSFALAGDVLVLLEMPCRYNFGAIMGLSGLLTAPASHVCMDWDAGAPTRAHVVPLRDPAAAVVHELPALFFFHVAGAAVRPAGAGGARAAVEVDVCAYDDPSILTALSLQRMLECSQPLPRNSRFLRLTLPLPGAGGAARSSELCAAAALGGFMDFPQRPRASGRLAGAVFAACAHGTTTASNCVARVDTRSGAVATWAGAAGAGEELLGEPAVVEAVGAEEPGDPRDVLLVSTHDRHGPSLVVLDAEEMREVARCRPSTDGAGAPVPVPYALHGEWLPA